jgi:chloride channel protein, CIC family
MFGLALQPNVDTDPQTVVFPARFWCLVVLTGIGAGIGAGALMRLLFAVQHSAFSYSQGTFLQGVEASTGVHRLLIVIGAGILAGTARMILRYTVGGHGGEICETVWFHSGKFPTLRTLSRAVLSIVLVGMGASIGREGSAKQAGAVAASKISDWGRLPPSQRRLLAACGAGAGMAAVYNVPFGGAVFALEVLLGTLTFPLVIPALAASLTATAVSWTMLPPKPSYLIPTYPLSLRLIGWALVAGPLAGVASVFYVRLIAYADAHKPKGRGVIAEPIIVFLLLGAFSIVYPQLLGNGKDLVQQLYWAKIDVSMSGVLLILKPLATAGCLGSGAPGGLFTPTLTFGALFGILLGQMWGLIWPGVPPGSCAILGSSAVLAATTEGPVSSIILVLELTRRIDVLMVPLMLAVAGASIAGRILDCRSIYSARVRIGRTAATICAFPQPASFEVNSKPTVSTAARYSEVARRIIALGVNSAVLRVVDNEGKMVGELTAHDMINPHVSIAPLETTTAADLARPVSGKVSDGAD